LLGLLISLGRAETYNVDVVYILPVYLTSFCPTPTVEKYFASAVTASKADQFETRKTEL
jgi:hypothetical protein